MQGALFWPDSYMLTGSDSGRLEVMSEAEGEAPNQVVLALVAPAVEAWEENWRRSFRPKVRRRKPVSNRE